MHFKIPEDTRCVMGHTRMTTQGDELHNYNNHPFLGTADVPFALAHNGIIHNDSSLRTEKSLPCTKIETDSYVAVQLLAQQGNVSFRSIRAAVEPLRGALTLTILDSRDDLYIVRGNNPLALYHFPRLGLYVYANTEAILRKGLKQGLPTKERPFDVPLQEGDILRIDTSGRYTTEVFDTRNLWNGSPYFLWPYADIVPEREYILQRQREASPLPRPAASIRAESPSDRQSLKVSWPNGTTASLPPPKPCGSRGNGRCWRKNT